MQSVVIIDGNSLLHRGFHAMPRLTTRSGEPTGAMFGFSMLFLKVLQDLNPDYLMVTFDRPEPTFRHKIFAQYKGQRPEMDATLALQVPKVKELVGDFNLPIFEIAGFEADDLIGTITTKVLEELPDCQVTIVTGDKDAFQLIAPRVRVYTMKRGLTETVVYDEVAVRQRYGFDPDVFIDCKALMGDPSDNIPGVQGIGEKTATSLVASFGSLESIYENIANGMVGERAQRLLVEGKEQAFFSRQLVTIDRNVPMELDITACAFRHVYDRDRVIALFQSLEFHSLISKLPNYKTLHTAEVPSSLPQQQESFVAPMISGNYTTITTDEQFAGFFDKLVQQPSFAFDTETTSEQALLAELVGMSFAWTEGEAFYLVMRDDEAHVRSAWLDVLQAVFSNPAILLYGHNIKYDSEVLAKYGIPIEGKLFDTMVAAYLLHPGESLGLKSLALSVLGVTMTPITDLIGKGKDALLFDQVPLEQASVYACADADATLRLAHKLQQQLGEVR